MLEFRPTESFERAVRKLDNQQRDRVRTALKELRKVPPPHHLHFKWLKPTIYWSARVDRNYRLILIKKDEHQFDLIDVCRHSVYDRKYATH